MYLVSAKIKAAARELQAVDPRGIGLATGRSLLAFAELTAVAFTPDRSLFVFAEGHPAATRCTGVPALSLWCTVGEGSYGHVTARLVTVVILVAVTIGYRPRWTCVPHWYISFSFATSVSMANGGDDVARVATLLLIPILLGDDRRWHWSRPTRPMDPSWQGTSAAAFLVLRLQVTVIYGTAAVSKMAHSEWRDGSAVYAIISDPNFGMPQAYQDWVERLVVSPAMAGLVTWGVIGGELFIACCVLGTQRIRYAAVAAAVALHVAIIVCLGLFSFGLVMIGLLFAACSSGTRRNPADPPRTLGVISPPVRATAGVDRPLDHGGVSRGR